MKKRLIFPLLAILVVASFVIGLNIQTNSQDNFSDSVTYHSNVCKQVVRADGTRETPECSSNILYDTGKDLIRNYLSDTGGTGDEVDQIVLCNATSTVGGCGTPLAGATEMFTPYTGCGLEKATGTYSSFDTSNWTISHEFTASCDNLLTNVTKLQNTTGVGNFSSNAFTLVTLQTDDKLLINWSLSVS